MHKASCDPPARAAVAGPADRVRTAFQDVFRNPALRRLQLAWAGSILGTWAYGIAVVVYAYDQGGATAVGHRGPVRWCAAAFVSPFAALLGDRYTGGASWLRPTLHVPR